MSHFTLDEVSLIDADLVVSMVQSVSSESSYL